MFLGMLKPIGALRNHSNIAKKESDEITDILNDVFGQEQDKF